VGDNLYVANAGVTGTVFRLKPNSSAAKDAKPVDRFTIETAGQGRFITALSGLENYLYGIQAGSGFPLQELSPIAEPVSLMSWGRETYSQDAAGCPIFDLSNIPRGFVADPLSKRHFFISNPSGNFIASIRDLNQAQLGQGDGFNSNGLSDLEYPLQKPPHTFRIMIVGRSYVYFVYDRTTKAYTPNRSENLPKRLELFLNLSASLEDQPLRFEVFNCGKIMGQQLYLWPMDVVPDLAKKYDIDLVLLLMDPETSLQDYFLRRPNPQGLPSFDFDSEYVLKPFSQRIPPGTPKKFYDLCLKYKLLERRSETKVDFHSLAEMLEYSDVKDCLLEMIGKPLDVLNQRLKNIKLSNGPTPHLEICYFPGNNFNADWCNQAGFWRQLTQKWGLDIMDLSDVFTSQRLALYPIDGAGHFDTNGLLWLSYILKHQLIDQKIIPWTVPKP
jgi:hypothetical protein